MLLVLVYVIQLPFFNDVSSCLLAAMHILYTLCLSIESYSWVLLSIGLI